MRDPPSWHNHFEKALPPNTITWGFGYYTWIWRGHRYLVCCNDQQWSYGPVFAFHPPTTICLLSSLSPRIIYSHSCYWTSPNWPEPAFQWPPVTVFQQNPMVTSQSSSYLTCLYLALCLLSFLTSFSADILKVDPSNFSLASLSTSCQVSLWALLSFPSKMPLFLAYTPSLSDPIHSHHLKSPRLPISSSISLPESLT